jgi:hypothetical protein
MNRYAIRSIDTPLLFCYAHTVSWSFCIGGICVAQAARVRIVLVSANTKRA